MQNTLFKKGTQMVIRCQWFKELLNQTLVVLNNKSGEGNFLNWEPI